MALAVVQAVANANNQTPATNTTPSVTFGSAPTQGNLMVVTGLTWGGSGHLFVPANGWANIVPPGSSGFQNAFAAYKYAGASEPALQNFATNTTGVWGVCAWEVSGVQGHIAGDLITTNLLVNVQVGPTAGPITPGAVNSAAGATLILYCFPSYSQSASTTFAIGAPWTLDAQFCASHFDVVNNLFDYGVGAHQIVSSAGGTSLQPTLTPSASTFWANSLIQLGETALSGGAANLQLLGVG